MTLAHFTQTFIFSYGVVFLNFAVAVLLIRQKKWIHWVSSIFMLDFAAMCIAGGISMHSDNALTFPNLWVFIPLILLSPLGTLFTFAGLGVKGIQNSFLHFIIGGTCTVFVLGIVFIWQGIPWHVIFTLAYCWLFITYLLMINVAAKDLWPIKLMPRGLKFFFSLVGFL